MGSKRFENEKTSRLLITFALPIILELLVFEMYNLVDTFFVGRFVHKSAIAALMVVYPIQRLYCSLSVLIGVGASTMLSRTLGARGEAESRAIIRNGFLLMSVVTLSLVIATFLFPEFILSALGAQAEILPEAISYLKYISTGAMFIGLTTYMAYILLSFGDTKVSVIATSIGAVGNIILNTIWIFIFHMGVSGAGLGSLLSQFMGFVYAFVRFKKLSGDIQLKMKGEFMLKLSPAILLGGLSAFIIEAEDSVVIGVLNRILAGSMGNDGIVILGLIMKVYMFIFIALFGVVSAMQPIAAYYYGAGRKDKLQELMNRTLVYSFLSTLILWLLFQLFSKQMVGFFLSDSLIIEKAACALRTVVAVFPVVSLYYMGIFYFQARGNSGISLVGSLLRQMIILLPTAYFLSRVMGLGGQGVWLAYPVTDILSTLVMSLMIKKETKLQLRPARTMMLVFHLL